MKITLKDGSIKDYSEAMSAYDIARDISEGLARAACAVEINGEVKDLRTVIDGDCELNVLTAKDADGIRTVRHTCSHVLAEAVKRLYPNAKLAIGPSIDEGFYYDFEAEPFSREDLDNLEKEMKKIIKEGNCLEKFTLPREEAIAYMKEKEEPYKVELIEDLPEDAEISFYKQGEGFTDLCAGPHLMNTKGIKVFKLISSSMAYWRGDSDKAQLQRIYGTAFATKDELNAYLEHLEDIKKRDHNKLGREMELFTTVDVIGQGLPLLMPKGAKIIQTLQRWIEDLEDNEWGYIRTKTPLMAKSDLYKISGHWDHYRENMYTTVIDDMDFAVKPMNCPGGMLVYKMEPRSYKELPLRLGELGLVHRHEKSGQLHGLMRVRCFTQDDAHIFMTEAQIENEIQKVVKLIDEVYKKFGFTYHVELSTRPDDSMGTEEEWEVATNALENAIKAMNIPYEVNEGDGAFYGPKLDFHLQDSIGRTWQCGTIQLDFQLPQRFEAEYIGADGEKHRPIMIHRVVFGSIERFIGILIEHYAGKFPTWLAPVQAKVLPVSDKFAEYAKKVSAELTAKGVRVEMDDRDEKLGYKIRQAQLQKVPYMLIVGEKEQNEGTVSVRKRDVADQNDSPELGAMSVEEFAEIIEKEI